MKTAIVTGANGFVGHHLINTLTKNEYKIYAVVRNENENIDNIVGYDNVEIIYCDMAQCDKLPELIREDKIDYLYHLAWAGNSGQPRTDYELQLNNVLWTCRLIEVAHLMHIPRMLVAGSVTQLMYREYLIQDQIAPEMVTCYAIGKMCAESLCKCLCTKYGIDLCWTYISNFYGADDTTNNFINFLIDHYKNGIVPVLTSAEQLADFTYVTDIARGLMFACEKGRENSSYYIGYGSPKPLKEFILELKKIVNPKVDSGIGAKEFHGENVDYTKIDLLKLRRDTGFEAEVDFEKGIEECCRERLR